MDIVWKKGNDVKKIAGLVLQAINHNYNLSAFTESWHSESQTNYFGEWISPKELECLIPLSLCDEFIESWNHIKLSEALRSNTNVYLALDNLSPVNLTGFQFNITDDQENYASLILSVSSFGTVDAAIGNNEIAPFVLDAQQSYLFYVDGIFSDSNAPVYHVSSIEYRSKEKAILLNDNRTIMSTGSFPSEVVLGFQSKYPVSIKQGFASLMSSIVSIPAISVTSLVEVNDSRIHEYKQYSLTGVAQ